MTIAKYQKVLFHWLSQFAPAYNSAMPPRATPSETHIVAPQVTSPFSSQFAQPVYLFALNATSNAGIVSIADRIKSAVGEGGILIHTDEGVIRVELGTPFYQDRTSPDMNTRAGYVLLSISIY